MANVLNARSEGTTALRSSYTCSGGRIFSTLPSASSRWYSFHDIGGLPVSTSFIVMHPLTGQTSEHRLQPTHVSCLIVKRLIVSPPAPGNTSTPPERRTCSW